jgi:hypothetical protein
VRIRHFPKLHRRLEYAHLLERRDRVPEGGLTYDLPVFISVKHQAAYSRLFPSLLYAKKLTDVFALSNPLDHTVVDIASVTQHIENVDPRWSRRISVLENLEGKT